MHGLSVPIGKLGVYMPRSLSEAVSQANDRDPEPFAPQPRAASERGLEQRSRPDQGISLDPIIGLPTPLIIRDDAAASNHNSARPSQESDTVITLSSGHSLNDSTQRPKAPIEAPDQSGNTTETQHGENRLDNKISRSSSI